MSNHILKVEPNSEAEKRLTELFDATAGHGKVVVRIGAVYDWPYNEYEFSEERYQVIRNYLYKGDPT